MTMTIIEAIEKSRALTSYENDSIEKLIAIAYHTGREHATKILCDEYQARIKKARAHAEHTRYYKLAHSILDALGGDIIYSGDYAGDIRGTFGSDTTTLLD